MKSDGALLGMNRIERNSTSPSALKWAVAKGASVACYRRSSKVKEIHRGQIAHKINIQIQTTQSCNPDADLKRFIWLTIEMHEDFLKFSEDFPMSRIFPLCAALVGPIVSTKPSFATRQFPWVPGVLAWRAA